MIIVAASALLFASAMHLWLVWLALGPLRAALTTVPTVTFGLLSLIAERSGDRRSAKAHAVRGWVVWVILNVATFIELLARGLVRVVNDFLP